MGVRGGCRRAFDNPLRRAHLVSRKAPGAPLTFLPRHRLASARLPRRPWPTRRSSTRTRSRAPLRLRRKANPSQARMWNPEAQPPLRSLNAHACAAHRCPSEPAILLRRARVAGKVRSRTQTTRPHALTPTPSAGSRTTRSTTPSPTTSRTPTLGRTRRVRRRRCRPARRRHSAHARSLVCVQSATL